MPMNDKRTVVNLLEQGCHAWRCGNDLEGIAFFQRACLDWLAQLDETEKGASSTSNLIVPLLVHLMDHVHAQDMIGATDVVEWELIPVLRSLE